MADVVKAGVSQRVKVQNPSNKWENADFFVSAGFDTEIESCSPEATAEEREVWAQNRARVLTDSIQELREVVEVELQSDIDKFQEDNS